jgi:vancomycin permeability regulator SanA
VGANKPKSYAEQEAMRKALEEMHPPTNAIN